MRSKSENRKLKYSSVRQMVEKRALGFTAPYLKPPEGVQFFKPKIGIMHLDIMPFRAGEGNPSADEGMIHWERTIHVHRGVGANSDSYLCPRKTSKQPCPICEFQSKLRAQGDEDKEELAKSLFPKERQLFNVINRKEPDKGVQLWDISFHLFGKLLLARIRDSDEEDGWDRFPSLDEGFTLKVGFAEKTFGGRAYPEAETIDFKPRSEPYDNDMLDKAHCLDELLVELDYKELKKRFLESTADETPARGKKKEDADDEEEDEIEEDEPKVGKKSYRKAEAEEDDEEEEEEDETPESKKKKAPADDDDDGWDDFDDEDEKPKAKKKKPAEDDEEESEDEDEADDEEEEEKPAKKKSKAKDEEDDFEDLDEEEEDEEEKPKSKKKK